MIFNELQAYFLKEELGVDVPVNKNSGLTRQKWVEIKDKCFDIEAEEAMAADGGNGPLSQRGKIAVSICDMTYKD